ncbi:hypothetical protein [Alteromonas confluentis]|uniref:Uncharacterized protein n=1 Tax=Alteromonas confluentis TaxID=1656094 RepID=A0A1E7ZBX2_9ALTE|nr:hypothetical protein [Alteromonas confluentis]OFC71007.1 hypothetical protein BFC18_11270 [Alteromonas confluentis]
MTARNKPNGPLTGWLEAGSELVAEQLAGVTKQVNAHIENQQRTIDELQARGAVLDAKIKQALSPATVLDNVEQMVKANPLWSLVPTFNNKGAKRAEQLDALSAKVDLLVEQVALLAAKEAKVKAEKLAAEKLKQAEAEAVSSASTETVVKPDDDKLATPEKPTRRPSTRKKTVATTPKVKTRSVSTAKPPTRS